MILKAHEISKSYKGKKVVNKVSVKVSQGEIVGLLGPNGAGKTTSFYMIVGIIKPEEGEIYLDNEKISTYPMYKRAQSGIGYLAQEASVFRKLSVEENILSILEFSNLSKSKQKERTESLMEEFGLTHIRHNRGDLLSGGERRRTEIARCLINNPKVLLLDEPFAGVDLLSIQEIKGLLLKLQARGCAVLVTDHNASQLLSVVDRAYVIANGSIIANDTPRQIVNNVNAKKLYFGDDFI